MSRWKLFFSNKYVIHLGSHHMRRSFRDFQATALSFSPHVGLGAEGGTSVYPSVCHRHSRLAYLLLVYLRCRAQGILRPDDPGAWKPHQRVATVGGSLSGAAYMDSENQRHDPKLQERTSLHP